MASAADRKPGEYVRAEDRATCKYCGTTDLAWYRTKAGRWNLCKTVPSRDENKAIRHVRYLAPWSPHRCGETSGRSFFEEQARHDETMQRIEELERMLGL
jgi:hypothetical protein